MSDKESDLTPLINFPTRRGKRLIKVSIELGVFEVAWLSNWAEERGITFDEVVSGAIALENRLLTINRAGHEIYSSMCPNKLKCTIPKVLDWLIRKPHLHRATFQY